jgi:hypothetical protein
MPDFKFRTREFPKETFIGDGYDRSEASSSRTDTDFIDYSSVSTKYTFSLFLPCTLHLSNVI